MVEGGGQRTKMLTNDENSVLELPPIKLINVIA